MPGFGETTAEIRGKNWKLPPGDPLLLKHLAGTLYAVLAVWDLTELERAVFGGRMRTS